MKTQKLRALLVQKSDSNESVCNKHITKFVRAIDELYANIIDYLTSADPDHRYFHVSTFEAHIRDFVGSYKANELNIDIGEHRLIFRPIQSLNVGNCGVIQITIASNTMKPGLSIHLNSKYVGTPTEPISRVIYDGYVESADQWTFSSHLKEEEAGFKVGLAVTRFLNTPNSFAILLEALL